jgi:hypothetical protein
MVRLPPAAELARVTMPHPPRASQPDGLSGGSRLGDGRSATGRHDPAVARRDDGPVNTSAADPQGCRIRSPPGTPRRRTSP